MKYLKLFEDMTKLQYNKQCDGEYIEIVAPDSHVVADFEYFGNGVFIGTDYTDNYTKNYNVIDIGHQYDLSGEKTAKQVNNLIVELKEQYSEMNIVGYDTFKKKFGEFL